jgi:hypothetical protein
MWKSAALSSQRSTDCLLALFAHDQVRMLTAREFFLACGDKVCRSKK